MGGEQTTAFAVDGGFEIEQLLRQLIEHREYLLVVFPANLARDV
jgi:hypothetical protein